MGFYGLLLCFRGRLEWGWVWQETIFRGLLGRLGEWVWGESEEVESLEKKKKEGKKKERKKKGTPSAPPAVLPAFQRTNNRLVR